MTEDEARAKAIALYDNTRDDCRIVAEAKIAYAFAELYLEAFALGAQYALERAERRYRESAERQQATILAFRDSGILH